MTQQALFSEKDPPKRKHGDWAKPTGEIKFLPDKEVWPTPNWFQTHYADIERRLFAHVMMPRCYFQASDSLSGSSLAVAQNRWFREQIYAHHGYTKAFTFGVLWEAPRLTGTQETFLLEGVVHRSGSVFGQENLLDIPQSKTKLWRDYEVFQWDGATMRSLRRPDG